MKLSSFLQYENKKTSTERKEEALNRAFLQDKGEGRRLQDMKSLFPGQTLNGEIIGMDGKEIQIRTDQELIVNARLEKELSLMIGQSLTFEVKSSGNGQVALRPLFENMAQDVNLLKALEAARLPASDPMINMVSLMMRQGMSIDKQALHEMNRLVTANPGAAPELVVMLKGMGIQVTPENLEQLKHYLNLEHSVLKEMTQVADRIPETIRQMISAGQLPQAAEFLRQLSLFFGGETSRLGFGRDNTESSITLSGGDTNSAQQADQTGQAMGAAGVAQGTQTEQNTGLNGSLKDNAELLWGQSKPEDSPVKDMGKNGANEPAAGLPGSEQQPASRDTAGSIGEVLSKADCQNLSLLLGKLGADQQFLAGVREGTVTGTEVLETLAKILSEQKGGAQAAVMNQLFSGREMKQVLRNELMQQWLLKPEEVTGGRQVADFYRRLSEQTQKLTQAAEQSAKDAPLTKTLTTLQNNVQFMNQMNQVYQFVQLPLKMMEGNTNGELYVYKRKGQSLSDDGSVTALLHLDMEHLGSLDVHIAMLNETVTTKFYLEDEKTMDFLERHMSSLDQALSGKGYHLKTELIHKEDSEKADVISRLSEADSKAAVMAQYSFDVRA